MRWETVSWDGSAGPEGVLAELLARTTQPGVVVLRIEGGGAGPPLPGAAVRRLRESRAVTVADLSGAVGGGALELAAACDLLYARRGAVLDTGGAGEVPPPAVVEAFRSAGLPALRRLLLEPGPVTAAEAVELGVAAALLAADEPLPLPAGASLAALTAARDLMRASATGPPALALESAAFRLLFAGGQPQEGGRAFLEGRDPDFDAGGG